VLITAGSRHSTHTSRPSARVRDADNTSSSSTVVRKRTLSSAADPPPPKKAAMCILSPLDSDEEDEGDNEGVPSSPPTQEGSLHPDGMLHIFLHTLLFLN
jgi:hypothetical protein